MRWKEITKDVLIENTGKIIKNVNTTCDVDLDEIKTQAKKFGNDVDEGGIPVHSLYTVHKEMGKK